LTTSTATYNESTMVKATEETTTTTVTQNPDGSTTTTTKIIKKTAREKDERDEPMVGEGDPNGGIIDGGTYSGRPMDAKVCCLPVLCTIL